jgi:Fur family ferric uptake transcriptional regulator
VNPSKQQALLDQFKLRHTACRLEVVAFFLSKNFAIAHIDLEHAFKKQFDRVTLYRTLKTFLDKGIIHKVLDDEGTPKYALCPSACTHLQHHHHDHIHFKCNVCGQTTCMEDIFIPEINLPVGFKVLEKNILMAGICPQCSENKML